MACRVFFVERSEPAGTTTPYMHMSRPALCAWLLLLAPPPVRGSSTRSQPAAPLAADAHRPALPAFRPPLRALSEPMLRFERALDGAVATAAGALNPTTWLRGRGSGGSAGEAPYLGTWTKCRIVGADAFLEEAMGVPWVKRRAAVRGRQTQVLSMQGKVVHLSIADLRGTKRYTMVLDGSPQRGKGFCGLPVETRVTPRAGGLDMRETYSHALGGAEHGSPCRGGEQPTFVSRREVVGSGEMCVSVSRKLPCGRTVKMSTFYARAKGGGS